MSFVVGINPSGVYAAPPNDEGKTFGLGDRAETYGAKRWMFVSASTSVTSYQVVAIDSAGVARPSTYALSQPGGRAGVAQNAISAGSYGWVQIYGACSVNVLSTCSASAALYTSATAGALDDTSTSQTKVAGLTINANVTAAATTAAFMACEPYFAL